MTTEQTALPRKRRNFTAGDIVTLVRERREFHKSNDAIAQELGVSPETIRVYAAKMDGRTPWSENDVKRLGGKEYLDSITPTPYVAPSTSSKAADADTSYLGGWGELVTLVICKIELFDHLELRSLHEALKQEILRRYDEEMIG